MVKSKKASGVLYRRYRPQDWQEVIGQDHIVKVLEGQVKLDKLGHAYLFFGSRGIGKTSVARILSQALGTSPNDLTEMDAASNRGIDEIRALRDSVNSLPFESRYKVYIIDEVHMLTRDAWNAFLKTLEEPPAHVIFILATTELEKVPETVISRCQTFTFKQPNQATLRDFSQRIAKEEGVKLEKDAAELVALLSDGSFRDAHGILEKVLSSTKDKKITRSEVEEVSGAPRASLVRDILEALVDKDLEKGLQAIHLAVENNASMKLFSKLVLERLRYFFLLRLKAGMDNYIENQVSEDDFKFLQGLAGRAGPEMTAEVLLKFISAYEDSGRTSIPELALEMALVDTIRVIN